MKFSFIIPTKNEGKYLDECLMSIKNQTIKDYEIIVVDSNSTDDTIAIARKHGAKIVKEARKGPAVARNTGANHAKGEILVFCDADVRFGRNLLSGIKEKFTKNIGGCCFRLCTYDATKRSHQMAYEYVNNITDFLHKIGITVTVGSLFVFDRDVFFKNGGFNERLFTNEDNDLAIRVNRIKRFIFCKDISIETSSRRVNRLGLLRAIKIYTKSNFMYVINDSGLHDYWLTDLE